jgi:hypothetical protein
LYTFAWWRLRFIELAVAVVFGSSLIYLIGNINDQRKAGISAENWFTVNKLYVPNTTAGEDPIITYDRTIKEPFRGFWVTEVQRLDESSGAFTLECSGSGINDYEIVDYIPNNQVRWSWYVGNKCSNLTPGQYRLRSSWKMRRSSWPDKEVVVYSNLFQIRPSRP